MNAHDSKKKILIAAGIYPPEIGGPATYVRALEEHLPSCGYEITVLPFSEVRWLPKIIRHVAYFFKCLSRARGMDLIFAQDPVSVGFPAMLVAKILRKPFFLRIGGDYAWEQGVLRYGITDSLDTFVSSKKRMPFVVSVLRSIQRNAAQSATRVSVQSRYMKEIVVQWGISDDKIAVVPNGFSESSATIDKEQARTSLGLRGSVGFSVGRMVPWKGFDEVIKIVPELKKKFPDFILYIVGDGPDEIRLKEIARTHGLEQDVIFTGRLERGRLMRYLRAADVFVLNTSYEGFSNQLLEAYAAGTPIVTTNVCGNPEAVEHRVSGLLVEPNDPAALLHAVDEVLRDVNFASHLISGGRKKMQEFSMERMIAATSAFLSS